MGSSSRDFVESYVKDISQDTEAYLAQQQPNYDASKATTLPTPPPSSTPPPPKKDDTPPPSDPSSHYAFHKATTNPIPSSDATQQEPTIVWTVRDVSDQRKEIHETALVNCSDLHVDLMQCFQHGSWWDKAKMCEDQKQKFWACFHSQKKFLKAANYKSPISTQEDDDVVLMRALNFRDQQEAAGAAGAAGDGKEEVKADMKTTSA